MDAATLQELERAELAAREQLLTAAAEAERLIEAARTEARSIEDAAHAEAAAAVAAQRERARAEAEAEVVSLESAEGAATGRARRPEAVDAAAEVVVAAVLGEGAG